MRQIVGAQAAEILVLLHGKQSSCHQRQSHAHHPIGARIGQEMLPVERISHFERVATRHHNIVQHHTSSHGISLGRWHNGVWFQGACQQRVGLSVTIRRGKTGILQHAHTVGRHFLHTPAHLVISLPACNTALRRHGKQDEQYSKTRTAHAATCAT